MLTIYEHRVRDVQFRAEASLRDGLLIVVPEELRTWASHPLIRSLNLHIARPGEHVRIIRILDAVQPRAKGKGVVFPGFLGPAHVVGTGETHILTGCAVLSVSFLPRAQEALIDMAGPGALVSPFAQNVLLEGIPPGLFGEGRGAVVGGRYTPEGLFQAGLIMAKHAEEYKPLEEGKKAEVEELLKTLMKPEDRQ